MSVWFGVAPVRGEPALVDWEPTGLTEPTLALFTPTSGAFFARTESALMRSDDGGANWRTVPFPPGVSIGPEGHPRVAVDPNDHTRMYVGAWVTRDDAATWTHLTALSEDPNGNVWTRVSAADPKVAYFSVVSRNSVVMRRSQDGGETWSLVLISGAGDFRPSSSVRTTLLEPHPTDPAVLFHTIVGFRGNGNQGILRRSEDQGGTFREALASTLRYPTRLVGGQGPAPERFYAAMTSEEISSAIFKSDDGGATWVEAGTFGAPSATLAIRALAYDPAAPERVWIALDKGGVKASEDGGQTWSDLSPTDWSVNDVALGIDGANLYAATTAGVFRLPLR